MTARGKKATFPDKLWQMVNDCRLDSAIRWTDNGTSFEISEGELKKLCLGKGNKLFYTEQPKSFVRQLHMYGFKKIKRNQFQHCYFQRNRPQLLKNIKRSYKNYPLKSGSESPQQQVAVNKEENSLPAIEQSTNATNITRVADYDNPSPLSEHYLNYSAFPSALQPINADDKDPLKSMTPFSDNHIEWQYDFPYPEQQLFQNHGCREETFYECRDDSLHYYNDLKPLEYMY